MGTMMAFCEAIKFLDRVYLPPLPPNFGDEAFGS